MKNRKIFLSTICLSAVAGLALTTSACASLGASCDGGQSSSAPTEIVCVPPEVTATNEGFYWASVSGAKSYQYKINESAWASVSGEKIPFPTTAGAYTLYMKAVDEKGKDGRISETAFQVAVLEAACEQVENTLVMSGTQICYSVNGGEEAFLGADGVLDFSSATAGEAYSVSYYAKGEFWSQEAQTYYISSQKQTTSITVGQSLSAPILRVENDALVWAAVENATAYTVTIDGESKSQTELRVTLPNSSGEHTVTVRATSDGEGNTPSQISELTFTVKTDEIPAVTYDKALGVVAWDSAYAEKMTVSTDGESFVPAQASTTAAVDGLRLKLNGYFDERESVYYVNSKTVSFAKRSLSELAFHTDGYVVWNTEDEGQAKAYGVSVVKEEQASAYNLANNNVKNISSLTAGAYTIEVYASDYVEEKEGEILFHLPSERKSLAFKVLEKPALSYEGNKLTWSVDEFAARYEYKTSAESAWTTVSTEGYVEVPAMDTYEVRAIGSDEAGKYSLTSSTSSLFFDPTLEGSAWGETLASFNNDLYLKNVTNATGGQATATGTREIITEGNASEEEKAILAGTTDGGMLKVTAGNAKPLFAAHFGNGDGMNFYLFTPATYDAAKSMIFRVYIPSSAQRKNAWSYNGQGEHVNAKDRTLDEYGNAYAFFDGDTLIGYLGSSSNILTPSGKTLANGDTLGEKTVEKVEYDGKSSMTVTFSDKTTLVMARRAYGVLADDDSLLGIADEAGNVKNGDTLVGTLNEKGELVDGEGNVLSTSAVKKTQDLDGNFCFGVEGSTSGGTEYKDNWFRGETAVETDKWVEFAFPISAYSNMTEFVRVTARFCFSAQAGDAFYIDEIRYEETPPNAMPADMLYAGAEGETVVNPIGWRTDVDGADNWDGLVSVTENGLRYYNANATTSHAFASFIFVFDAGTTLEVGDKVVINFTKGEVGAYNCCFNGNMGKGGTYFAWITGTATSVEYTVTEATATDALKTVNITLGGKDNVGGRDITIESIYIVKAK